MIQIVKIKKGIIFTIFFFKNIKKILSSKWSILGNNYCPKGTKKNFLIQFISDWNYKGMSKTNVIKKYERQFSFWFGERNLL